MKYFINTIFILAVFSIASAEEWLVSDQPFATPSPYTVPMGVTQYEFGVSGVSLNGDVMSWTYPQLLVRAGLTQAFELRLGMPGYTTIEGEELHVTHFDNILLEGKIQIGGKNALVPGVIIVYTNLPTEQMGIDSGYVDFGARYAGGIDNAIARAGWSLGAFTTDVEGEQRTYTTFSVSLGLNVVPRVHWYVEFYGSSTAEEEWQPLIDTGLLVRIAPNAQFDIYWGAGLTENTPDFIVGAGFAFALH